MTRSARLGAGVKTKTHWELVIPPDGDSTLAGYLFETRERGEAWINTPFARDVGYTLREVMVEQCACCLSFHIRKECDE